MIYIYFSGVLKQIQGMVRCYFRNGTCISQAVDKQPFDFWIFGELSVLVVFGGLLYTRFFRGSSAFDWWFWRVVFLSSNQSIRIFCGFIVGLARFNMFVFLVFLFFLFVLLAVFCCWWWWWWCDFDDGFWGDRGLWYLVRRRGAHGAAGSEVKIFRGAFG